MRSFNVGKLLSKKSQNLTEVAILVGIVGVVFMGMQLYVQRGLQGKLKDFTDSTIGKEQRVSVGDESTSVATVSSTSIVTKAVSIGGGQTKAIDERSRVQSESRSIRE